MKPAEPYSVPFVSGRKQKRYSCRDCGINYNNYADDPDNDCPRCTYIKYAKQYNISTFHSLVKPSTKKKLRNCMRCPKKFMSKGPGHRICTNCELPQNLGRMAYEVY